MRKRWIAVVVLVLGAGYWVWPYYGAYTLARAAEARDGAAVAARVDFVALRRSVARQVIRTYLRESGRADKLGTFGRNIAVAVGTTVADPYLAELLSPESLTALLGDGRLKPITIENRTVSFDEPLPRLPDAFGRNILPVILDSYYDGLTSFVFHVPGDGSDTGRYGIHLRLGGGAWRLAGVDLPKPLLDKIAADIIAKEKAQNAS